MEIKETLITPATATTWLEGNTHNRSVRDATVQRYARDMKAGRWLLTHQGIAFGPDGKLIDGQHRLWAIVESGTAIKMMVARGVALDAQAVIDDNMPRTAADALKLRYDKPARTVDVAIAKLIIEHAYPTGKPSRQEIVTAYNRHEDAIRFASDAFPRMVRGVTIAPVMTPVARAYYTHDHDKLARFGEILCSGLADKHEETALILRNWLIEGATAKKLGMSRAAALYGKTERALSAFLHGERVKTLYAATSELFPLPFDLEETKAPSVRRKLRIAATATPIRDPSKANGAVRR